MRVNNAVHVFDVHVSTALTFLAKDNPNDERITTVLFVDFVYEWFSRMSARNVALALGFRNMEKYQESVTFLKNAMYVFGTIKIGSKGHWKPLQTSALLSTKTVLDLSEYLLKERNFDFFLTSRLTQDCIENLFSDIRLKQVVPNAVQFKNNLKLIIMSKFMKKIDSSNYTHDEREMVSDFFKILMKNKVKKKNKKDNEIIDKELEMLLNIPKEGTSFNYQDMNLIYYNAGYSVRSILNTKQQICDNCFNSVARYEPYMFEGTLLTRI